MGTVPQTGVAARCPPHSLEHPTPTRLPFQGFHPQQEGWGNGLRAVVPQDIFSSILVCAGMYLSHDVKHRKRESVLHAFKHRDYWYCHCLGLPTNNAPSWVIYSHCIICDGWKAEKLFSTFGNDCSYRVREQYLISILKAILEAPDKLPEDGVCNTLKAKIWRTNKHWSHSLGDIKCCEVWTQFILSF